MIPMQESQVSMLGSQPADMLPEKPDVEDEPQTSQDRARRAQVQRWLSTIKKDKAFWKADFDRMKEDMHFVAGYQWEGQKKLRDSRYMANWTVQRINQKVATLYARNPKTVMRRRKRLDFQLWDGKVETVQQAAGAVLMGMQQMGFVPPEAQALLNDYKRGRDMQELVDKVGKTLEIVYQYQQDAQEPDFKVQAKQFVRRVCVCGVAYIKVLFCRDYEGELVHSETKMASSDRAKMAQAILSELVEGKIQEGDAKMAELEELIKSLNPSPLDAESVTPQEKLIFEFPPATAIIPDRRTRILKGWVGAHHITEEFIYPLSQVNAMFGTDIKPGGDLKAYDEDGEPYTDPVTPGETAAESEDPLVCLWQVYDLDNKQEFIVCDGYKAYVKAPEVVDPAPRSFWTIFPLTFNDVESEPGCKHTIFPPSDVDLMWAPQKEWNRTREALRAQRKANAPKYMCPKGTLSDADKLKIETAEDNCIVELENLAPGADPSKVVMPLQVAIIDPAVYDTKPIEEDAMLVTAMQEANVGGTRPGVTATVGSIAEHSRQTSSSSNVDDLDDCLSAVARCGGEMLLREMSGDTVRRIAGIGAVWPDQNRAEFLNEIELEIESASSGRPNKAIELDNFEKMANLFISSGANPQAIIREGIKRLDDNLDPADFYPLQPPGGQPGQEPEGDEPKGPQKGQPGKPMGKNKGQGQMNPPPQAPQQLTMGGA